MSKSSNYQIWLTNLVDETVLNLKSRGNVCIHGKSEEIVKQALHEYFLQPIYHTKLSMGYGVGLSPKNTVTFIGSGLYKHLEECINKATTHDELISLLTIPENEKAA